jgi:hypothetical protein
MLDIFRENRVRKMSFADGRPLHRAIGSSRRHGRWPFRPPPQPPEGAVVHIPVVGRSGRPVVEMAIRHVVRQSRPLGRVADGIPSDGCPQGASNV